MVDLLHEFELGIWKQVFVHLIRLLIAMGPEAVASMNERYVHLTEEMIVQPLTPSQI